MYTIKKFKFIILGLIIGILLSGSVVFAANNEYLLSLFQAKIIVNGIEKLGSDKPFQYFNGQTYVPTSLIYNGTTYVPLRFFSEALDQPVKYESKTKTIYVGEIPADEIVEQYMSDIITPYYKDDYTLFEANRNMSVAGKAYNKGYQIKGFFNSGNLSFNLEGKYTTIFGLVGLDDSRNNSDATIQIFGDEKLIKTIDIKAGDLPKQLNLDVTGVIKLDIKFTTGSTIDFVDLRIK